MVVRPKFAVESVRFGQWLGLTNTQRHPAQYHAAGDGHLYQRRFKPYFVRDDDYFLAACRYLELKPHTAELCKTPNPWRFGSLLRLADETKAGNSLLAPWPIPRRPMDRLSMPLR